ncbi:MAG: CpsB/CapC family capsule biosynthesis tyrosine phosphatase [Spirochaetota bacterium]
MIDIHTHILPDVDDGALSKQESTAALKEYVQAGFTSLVCTPHLHDPYVKTKILNIREAYRWLEEEASFYGIQVFLGSELYLGAEIGKYIPFLEKFQLVETNPTTEPLYLLDRVFDLQLSGLSVILAHVERYNWFSLTSDTAQRMREMGVLFQVNANSLHTKLAQSLIREGWVDFIASDNHVSSRKPIDFNSWLRHTEINKRSLKLLNLN